MGKYQNDAARLLELVGGKDNIAAVSHCITRMRFVLNDPAKGRHQGYRRTEVRQGHLHSGWSVPGHHRQHCC